MTDVEAVADAEAERREHVTKAINALDLVRRELWQAWQVPGAGHIWYARTGSLQAWHEMVCQLYYWLRRYGKGAEE